MNKDKVIRVRISSEQLIELQTKQKEFKVKFPNKRVTVGTMVRFSLHCFLKETCCVGRSRLEGVMSYKDGNNEFEDLI
jgi:repressor of nif and glnA expression